MFLPVTFSSHCICGCVGKSRFRWWEEDRNHLFPWAEPALPMLKQSLCQTFRPWTNSFDEIYLGLVIVTATILATNSAATELLISNYSSKDTSHCPNPPQPLHKERLKVSKRSLNVVSDHLLTITYHLRPCPDHTTSPGELWGQQVYPANQANPVRMSHPKSPCSGPPQHQSNSRDMPEPTHVPRRPRHRMTPQQRGTSQTPQTRRDHSGAARDYGSTTQEKHENRDEHNHTRAVHQGTTLTPTHTNQGWYITHPTTPPSPQHISFRCHSKVCGGGGGGGGIVEPYNPPWREG